MPLTLQQARFKLSRKENWRNIDPASLTDLINEACEVLDTYSRPKDSKERVGLTVYDDILTLPRQYATCLGLLRNNVPLSIRNGWIEFVLAGPGNIGRDDIDLCGEILDLGDRFCCIREPSTVHEDGCRLKVYTDAASSVEEAESIIEFYGVDADGAKIRTSDADNIRDGEAVALLGATGHVTTAESFATLTQVVKPVTKGVLTVYAIDPDDSSEHLVARYEPGETNPRYRRYRVPGDPDGGTTYTPIALCRTRFVPAVSDNDILCVDNFAALIDGLNFILYRDDNDDERAARALNRALLTLSKQALKFAPAATYPPMINDLDNAHDKTWQGY